MWAAKHGHEEPAWGCTLGTQGFRVQQFRAEDCGLRGGSEVLSSSISGFRIPALAVGEIKCLLPSDVRPRLNFRSNGSIQGLKCSLEAQL